MKKMLSILCLFCLFAVNIFANNEVEKIVKEIRKEFTNTNAEKKYTVKTIQGEGDFYTEFYIKNKKIKKIIFYYMSVSQDTVDEYYVKDDKIYFLYSTLKTHFLDDYGKEIKKAKLKEKRYYFDKNQELIRYIGPDKKIHNKGSIPEEYIDDAENYKTILKEDFLKNKVI
ncbi:hypothetical protein [Fusobacterium russii]|uniref:hypothetical protein n=1 Tax=Fusobacterium russii TaxID=854 RepID=UPI0003A548F9|nr:hypothetical protein [Fusobacterium russii]